LYDMSMRSARQLRHNGIPWKPRGLCIEVHAQQWRGPARHSSGARARRQPRLGARTDLGLINAHVQSTCYTCAGSSTNLVVNAFMVRNAEPVSGVLQCDTRMCSRPAHSSRKHVYMYMRAPPALAYPTYCVLAIVARGHVHYRSRSAYSME
jgi:hypothetical protein